jgi:hypothetical protein
MALEAMVLRLTEPNGDPVWLIASWIESVRLPIPGESPPETGAIVVLSSFSQAVREKPAKIIELMGL